MPGALKLNASTGTEPGFSKSRSVDMFTAIRRTKSLSAWLTMIVAIVVVSVSSVLMMSGLSQPHVDADIAAVTGVSTRGGLHSDTNVNTSVSPLVVGTSAASATSAPKSAQTIAATSSAGSAPQAASHFALSAASFAPASAANDTAASDAGAGLDAASAAHADKIVTPVDVAARRVAARAAARVAARREAAIQTARINRSLRADIALYNAERMAGVDRPQKLVPLRAASVPHAHSLWDEVPAPFSNLYRN